MKTTKDFRAKVIELERQKEANLQNIISDLPDDVLMEICSNLTASEINFRFTDRECFLELVKRNQDFFEKLKTFVDAGIDVPYIYPLVRQYADEIFLNN